MRRYCEIKVGFILQADSEEQFWKRKAIVDHLLRWFLGAETILNEGRVSVNEAVDNITVTTVHVDMSGV